MTNFIIKILQHWCQIQKSRPKLAPKMFIHSKHHSLSASMTIFQFPFFLFSYKMYNPRGNWITCQFSQSLQIFRPRFPFLQLSNIFTENLNLLISLSQSPRSKESHFLFFRVVILSHTSTILAFAACTWKIRLLIRRNEGPHLNEIAAFIAIFSL